MHHDSGCTALMRLGPVVPDGTVDGRPLSGVGEGPVGGVRILSFTLLSFFHR